MRNLLLELYRRDRPLTIVGGIHLALFVVMLAAAASYASLFLLQLWGALRGQSIAAPDTVALMSLAIWGALTLLVFTWIGFASRHIPNRRAT